MTQRSILAEYTLVGAFAAGLVALMLRYALGAMPNEAWLQTQIATYLSGIGAFVLFFRAMIAVYYALIWKVVHGQRVVAGKWIYTFNDRYDRATKTWASGGDQPGYAYFEHTVDGIRVHGQSSPPPAKGATNLYALWESTAAALNDFRLNVTVSLRSEDGSTEGFFILHIVPEERALWGFPRRPTMLRGYYYLFDKEQQSSDYARVEFVRDGVS